MSADFFFFGELKHELFHYVTYRWLRAWLLDSADYAERHLAENLDLSLKSYTRIYSAHFCFLLQLYKTVLCKWHYRRAGYNPEVGEGGRSLHVLHLCTHSCPDQFNSACLYIHRTESSLLNPLAPKCGSDGTFKLAGIICPMFSKYALSKQKVNLAFKNNPRRQYLPCLWILRQS